jgi:TRAP-type mannitol/chloroaromatic compound transport system permease small subunit
MTRLAATIERFVTICGRIAAWACLALILVTMFDVVTREFSQSSWGALRAFSAWQQTEFGSTKLQELEWHFHTMLFLLCLGWAYVKGAHVRIDVLRARLGRRAREWIEAIGVILFLLPFAALVFWYGIDFTATSFAQNEASASGGGLSHRWIIKAMVPSGLLLLILAGIARLLVCISRLYGDEQDHMR